MNSTLTTTPTQARTTDTTREHLSFWRRFWWTFLWVFCNTWFRLCYRYRAYGINNVPMDGPVLIVANHQSFVDPLLIGSALRNRPFFSLARKTLWDTRWAAPILTILNGIPLDQEASDLAAIRKGVEVLRGNHVLTIFAEGQRTWTGDIGEFEPGVMLLIRRAKPTILPIAVDGAFDVYPRGAKYPKLFGRMSVNIGEPIDAAEFAKMKPDEGRERLHAIVVDLHEQLKARRER